MTNPKRKQRPKPQQSYFFYCVSVATLFFYCSSLYYYILFFCPLLHIIVISQRFFLQHFSSFQFQNVRLFLHNIVILPTQNCTLRLRISLSWDSFTRCNFALNSFRRATRLFFFFHCFLYDQLLFNKTRSVSNIVTVKTYVYTNRRLMCRILFAILFPCISFAGDRIWYTAVAAIQFICIRKHETCAHSNNN